MTEETEEFEEDNSEDFEAEEDLSLSDNFRELMLGY